MELQSTPNNTFSRDHPDILSGYGTIALEIIEQLPNVDAILVPVGSGGLVAAVAAVIKYVKPACLVYVRFQLFLLFEY